MLNFSTENIKKKIMQMYNNALFFIRCSLKNYPFKILLYLLSYKVPAFFLADVKSLVCFYHLEHFHLISKTTFLLYNNNNNLSSFFSSFFGHAKNFYLIPKQLEPIENPLMIQRIVILAINASLVSA